MPSSEPKPRLLIVEDDAAALRQLRWTFDECDVHGASDRAGALTAFRAQPFPVVLLDLGLPPDPEGSSEGLAALAEILDASPETKVIVVTGREERAYALRAVELGAYDYYRKPVDPEEVRFLVRRAQQLHALETENRRLARGASDTPLPGVVSVSGAMRQVCRLVERAAGSDISVLFIGESGTGKEVLARALHALSARRAGPRIAINCAAIPEGLLESELFGHERGAFTGADRRVVGRLETASGGTLFLDEIGDIPAPVQVKLLRFLQERVIQRVGGREEIAVDTRVVSATHRPLAKLAGGGSFREDLFYRISELVIEVPPLRERPEDAVVIARHLLEEVRRETHSPSLEFGSDALAAVAGHAWPGNVRELENRVKRAVVLAEGPRVRAVDLGLATPASAPDGGEGSLRATLGALEREAVARAWSESGHNVSRASRLLGVSRPTLYKLLRDYGLRS